MDSYFLFCQIQSKNNPDSAQTSFQNKLERKRDNLTMRSASLEARQRDFSFTGRLWSRSSVSSKGSHAWPPASDAVWRCGNLSQMLPYSRKWCDLGMDVKETAVPSTLCASYQSWGNSCVPPHTPDHNVLCCCLTHSPCHWPLWNCKLN